MKVLLVHNKYQQAGGEDTVFESEGRLLVSHGHNVEYLIFDNKNIKGSVDRWLSGIRILYNAKSAKKLQEKIIEFNPDIIHVHNFIPIASPSIFFIAKKFDIPVVVTLHNYRLICPSATLFHNHAIYEKSVQAVFPWDAIFRGVYRNSRLETAAVAVATRLHNHIGTWRDKVDRFIVLTDFARKKFQRSALKISPKALVVKPNFVADFGIGEPVRMDFFLYIGRLTEEKGINVILKAFEDSDQKLVIIGDGPLRHIVEKFTQRNAKVSYLGFQPKETIIRYLKQCKALIFPSIWYEGFPMTILEALSTGTPVVASKLGSMADVVKNGINGLHFEPGNAMDLVNKLRMVNSDPDLMTRLSLNARADYVKYYTPETNYALLIDIYKKVSKTHFECHSQI